MLWPWRRCFHNLNLRLVCEWKVIKRELRGIHKFGFRRYERLKAIEENRRREVWDVRCDSVSVRAWSYRTRWGSYVMLWPWRRCLQQSYLCSASHSRGWKLSQYLFKTTLGRCSKRGKLCRSVCHPRKEATGKKRKHSLFAGWNVKRSIFQSHGPVIHLQITQIENKKNRKQTLLIDWANIGPTAEVYFLPLCSCAMYTTEFQALCLDEVFKLKGQLDLNKAVETTGCGLVSFWVLNKIHNGNTLLRLSLLPAGTLADVTHTKMRSGRQCCSYRSWRNPGPLDQRRSQGEPLSWILVYIWRRSCLWNWAVLSRKESN